MWDPQIILSDDDDDDPLLSPIRFYSQPKKPRIEPHSIPNPNPNPHPNATAASIVLVDDDDDEDEDADPTPRNPGPTSATSFPDGSKVAGIDRFICLESDNESEGGSKWETEKVIKGMESGFVGSKSLSQSTFIESTSTFFGDCDDALETPEDFAFGPTSLPDDIPQIHSSCERDDSNKDELEKRNNTTQAVRKKKMTEEEKARLKEEKKSKQLQEKLRKQALKAEAAESRKVEREKKKWENGKNALKSIVAEIDTKVIEMGSVGGNLLTRFAEKGINYRITSNLIERSILWTMKFPEHIQELSTVEIRYVLLVYDAEEFCNLVTNGSLFDHVFGVQSRYPTHTVCYLTNRLMSYVNKREQEHYKSPTTNWRRPPVEEVLAKLTTQFNKVHSRQCTDEAELAEHIAGLTLSLASCQFRKKLTRLCVNANGSAIPKDSIDKNLIKDNLWLKVLVAIPKVQPRFAVAIWKKYPTMKSLLMVYMDPTKSVHEKEFLLKDLKLEGLLGEDRRLGEVCSKRMYRILMAKCGSIKTDDVEDGADFF